MAVVKGNLLAKRIMPIERRITNPGGNTEFMMFIVCPLSHLMIAANSRELSSPANLLSMDSRAEAGSAPASC